MCCQPLAQLPHCPLLASGPTLTTATPWWHLKSATSHRTHTTHTVTENGHSRRAKLGAAHRKCARGHVDSDRLCRWQGPPGERCQAPVVCGEEGQAGRERCAQGRRRRRDLRQCPGVWVCAHIVQRKASTYAACSLRPAAWQQLLPPTLLLPPPVHSEEWSGRPQLQAPQGWHWGTRRPRLQTRRQGATRLAPTGVAAPVGTLPPGLQGN